MMHAACVWLFRPPGTGASLSNCLSPLVTGRSLVSQIETEAAAPRPGQAASLWKAAILSQLYVTQQELRGKAQAFPLTAGRNAPGYLRRRDTLTASEAMPLATTTNSDSPTSMFPGIAACVVTILPPVATPMLGVEIESLLIV